MVSLTTLPPDPPIESVLERLAEDGGVIIQGLLPDQTVTTFLDDIGEMATSHPPGATSGGDRTIEFWGHETKRFTRLAWRSRAFEDILMAPMLRRLSDDLLLPSCDDYWLNTAQMMIIGPGETAQMWHRDAGNWMTLCTPESPEVTISCMYALSDFTADVGATHVIPGSHLWDDYSQAPEPEQLAIAEMQAGDGLIYTGRVIHNGGANITDDQWRFGLHVSFVLGWLTPEEALPISVPWDAAQHLSERAQRLLGWKSYGVRSRLWTVDYEDIPVALAEERS